jgi:hypothetical protein
MLLLAVALALGVALALRAIVSANLVARRNTRHLGLTTHDFSAWGISLWRYPAFTRFKTPIPFVLSGVLAVM